MRQQLCSTKFEKLSYQKKLQFWEDMKLDYRQTRSLDADNLLLSILPLDKQQSVAYTKWVISHYRQDFFGSTGKRLSSGIKPVYFPYDQLVKKFKNKTDSLNVEGRTLHLDFEFNRIKAFIKKANPTLKLSEELELLFRQGDEALLYESLSVKRTSALLELRTIAKLWDIVKYKVYLEEFQYRLAGKNDSWDDNTSNHVPASFKPLRNVSSKQLSNTYLRMLFEDFKKHGFLQGDYQAFKDFSELKNIDKNHRLTWLDTAEKQKGINKQTLFKLFSKIFNVQSYADHRQLVKRYFVYVENDNVCDFNEKNVSQSLTDFKKREAQERVLQTKREKQLMQFFSFSKSTS